MREDEVAERLNSDMVVVVDRVPILGFSFRGQGAFKQEQGLFEQFMTHNWQKSCTTIYGILSGMQLNTNREVSLTISRASGLGEHKLTK